jgi:hypothetical protein
MSPGPYQNLQNFPGRFLPGFGVKGGVPPEIKSEINPTNLTHPTTNHVLQGRELVDLPTGTSSPTGCLVVSGAVMGKSKIMVVPYSAKTGGYPERLEWRLSGCGGDMEV